MKTKLLLFAVLALAHLLCRPQSATSIANGNWTNPFTWNCTCVPTPGYSVTVSHTVTLNTSFSAATGGITINSGALLVKDNNTRDIWINGGYLNNNGLLDVRYLYTQSGIFSNTGTITANAFMNSVNFTNTGSFVSIDSMYNTTGATLINNGSFLNIDSITNSGIFLNNGTCIFNQVTNNGSYTNSNSLTLTDITNNGSLVNADTFVISNSGWNLGSIDNQAAGYLVIGNSFLNDDIVAHDAVFGNDGRVDVADSWYNMDTVKGSGFYTVQDTSFNSGFFKGTFDFCDFTPPPTAPFVDINTGSIAGGITWCFNSVEQLSAKDLIRLFPNPATDIINFCSSHAGEMTVTVYNASGLIVLRENAENTIRVSALPCGLYTVRLDADGFTFIQKLQIIK
jgi:hypothetical protein